MNVAMGGPHLLSVVILYHDVVSVVLHALSEEEADQEISHLTFLTRGFPRLPLSLSPFIDCLLQFFTEEMNKRSRSPELELRMNLNRSPARSESPSVSIFSGSSSSEVSVENSCVSCEDESHVHHVGYSSRPEMITRSMVLVGCPGCLMYVMLTDKNSQCPKCKNNVFLDFLKQDEAYKN